MHMREKILNLAASKIANVHRSMLNECTVENKDPKISHSGNKNDKEESKANKTETYIQE